MGDVAGTEVPGIRNPVERTPGRESIAIEFFRFSRGINILRSQLVGNPLARWWENGYPPLRWISIRKKYPYETKKTGKPRIDGVGTGAGLHGDVGILWRA